MTVSGRNPRRNLVEIIELKNHPWFVAVQFHPEFQSKPSLAHPLFAAFVGAAMKYRRGRTADAGTGRSGSGKRKPRTGKKAGKA